MKRLHQDDLFCWSRFSEAHDIDFHSVLWVRSAGNILVDPLPLPPHDEGHLNELGPVYAIVITNSDHFRDAYQIAEKTGGQIYGPVGERNNFPIESVRWLKEGDEVVPGLRVFELEGSKTPGELALVLEEHTLICGDLIRCHKGGSLTLLPEAKLSDKEQALASVARLAALPNLETILLGDGWPIFHNAKACLRNLLHQANKTRLSQGS